MAAVAFESSIYTLSEKTKGVSLPSVHGAFPSTLGVHRAHRLETGLTVLVLLRAWATWGRHVRILAALATMFVVYAAASISFITWGIVSVGGMHLLWRYKYIPWN